MFVRTVDKDVLVIMIGIFHDLIALYPSAAIWVGLDMGKYVQYISVNAICTPYVSSFIHRMRHKKSAWDARKSSPDMTEAFKFLQDHPYQLDKEDSIFKRLERFTVVLHDKASNVINVNEACKEIFIKRNRTLENIRTSKLSSQNFVRSEIQTCDLFYCSYLFHAVFL